MKKEEKIYILAIIIVVGFFGGVVYHYYLGAYQGFDYPYNTFLFQPMDHFSDFYDVIRDGHTLNPYLGYNSAQYPLLAVFGYLFSLFPTILHNRHFYYCGMIGLLFLYFNAKNLKFGKWYVYLLPVFIITFLSYPFLFALDRGNLESLLFVFLLAFLFFYTKKQYRTSIIFLAIAIALKVYPAILLLLFVPEKKYREIILCIGITAALTVGSLLLFKGGLWANIDFLIHSTNISYNHTFTNFTSIQSNVVQRGVTLLTLIKVFYVLTGWMPQIIYDHFSSAYLALAVILGIPVCLYVTFVEKEEWKRVALLIFAMLLLPPLSADYKLLHLFLPLYLFINCKNSSKLDIVYLILFGLLLIPKDYVYLAGIIDETRHPISLALVVNILVMLATALLIMITGMKGWIKEKSGRHIADEKSLSPDNPVSNPQTR